MIESIRETLNSVRSCMTKIEVVRKLRETGLNFRQVKDAKGFELVADAGSETIKVWQDVDGFHTRVESEVEMMTDKNERRNRYWGHKLTDDVSVSTLYEMRRQGMTNKQIADQLGVTPKTIYAHIGRMSEQVKCAEITNKPSPVMQVMQKEPEKDTEKAPEIHQAKAEQNYKKDVQDTMTGQNGRLKVTYTRARIEGCVCKYDVDTKTRQIEMCDGLLQGVLDLETITMLIDELKQVRDMIAGDAIGGVA